MGINIITYTGKTRTAKHDAIVYDAALNRSGIFNGCAVTANASTVHVALGYGIIKGRVFEVTAEDFNVTLPGSGTRYGALIVTLDLKAASPIKLEIVTSNSEKDFGLTRDENVNFSNSRYQMPIATFTITSAGVSNVVQASHMLPYDHIGSTDFNDYSEPGCYYFSDGIKTYKNIPASDVSNGWLLVLPNPRIALDDSVVKQIFFRYGSSATHAQTWVRTKTDGVWHGWNRIVMASDLYTIDHSVLIGDSNLSGAMLGVKNKVRHVGLNVSEGKNAGIWDAGNNNWMIYSDKDQNVVIPHKLIVSSFEPTNIAAGSDASTVGQYVSVKNKYRNVGLHVSASENAGVFDFKNERWIIFNSKDNTTTIGGAKAQFDGPLRAPKSIVRGTITITPTKANTATYKDVTWAEMGGFPTIILEASTSIPETVAVGYGDVSKTGCRIYGTRTNGTGSFAVNYMAVYTA